MVRVERMGVLFNKYRLIKIISYLIVSIRLNTKAMESSVCPATLHILLLYKAAFFKLPCIKQPSDNLHKMQILT